MTRTIRCSSLPMLLACAHSQDESDLLIEAYNGASDLGTAVHDAMRSVVEEQPVDVPLFALRHGVSEKDLGPLIWYGRQAWAELAPSFPNPKTEMEVQFLDAVSGQLRLTGHIDLLSGIEVDNPDGFTFDTHARLLDWKSGRKEETDYYAQLAGYAVCLLLGYAFASVTATVVWLRSQTVETFTFTPADAHIFLAKLHAHLGDDARYRHGEHCAHCSRSHNCPALVANARRDLAIFEGDETLRDLATMPGPRLVTLRRNLRTLLSFADTMETAIGQRVATEGPLESGDGYELSLVEENGKREIDTLKAWPIVQDRLDDDGLMAGCLTFSASALDAAVAKKAGRGNGKAAKESLRADLEAAGALTQSKITKLKEVRIQPALKEKSNE